MTVTPCDVNHTGAGGKGNPPAAGASAGALASAVVCSGRSADEFHKYVNDLTSKCYKAPMTCAGNMDSSGELASGRRLLSCCCKMRARCAALVPLRCRC